MQSRHLVLLVAAGALAAVPPARAQCPQLTFTGSVAGAIDGGHAILTDFAPQAQVRFYEKQSSGWTGGQSFVIGDQVVFHPVAVAIQGDRAIAGTAEATTPAYWLSGRAFVFERAGGAWNATELISASVNDEDFFGAAVAIDGDVAVVRAAHGPILGDGMTRLHVFEFDGASWVETKQINTRGDAIDVSGDTLVVGDDESGAGYVDVYRRIGGVWSWTQHLYVYPPVSPNFGGSVAIEEDLLVVGASWPESTPGFVRAYRWDGYAWLPTQTIVPPDNQSTDAFGRSVALSNGTLLVSAPGDGAGVVHRYEHDGTSFVAVGSFGPVESTSQFGRGVSIDGEDAFIQSSTKGSFYRLGIARQESFCPTTPNSTGVAGALAPLGCDSISGQRLTLVASKLPPAVPALAFFGATAIQIPFGDGFRCIGGALFRLPATAADSFGLATFDIDFTTAAGSQLAAGQSWHFQSVYRDHAGAGAGFNLTNALSIGFTP